MYECNGRRETRTPQKEFLLELIDFCLLHTQQEYFKMRKSSASDGEGDETVRSGISHGGYVTADDNVELPNYLVHFPSHNYFIM